MSGTGDAIEAVRDRIDVIELIGTYVPLKRTGKNYKACCPFHDEKTPSFVVSPDRQTFHCFGCGEKGGAFDFVMRMERIEFREALELLAEKAGVTLDAQDPRAARERSQKAEVFQLNAWADGLFREHLLSSAGEAARSYVKSRGITAATARDFGIGFSSEGWTGLCSRAAAEGWSEELLEAAGLGIRSARRDGLYDRFRGRLMFPIFDAMGRTIAFGARSLDGSEPKYLNSPETELFRKGRTVFGIERLREHPREQPVLVMEGYTDVILATQTGVQGAVATLGTALTPDHAKLLGRYAEKVVLVYDGDKAGLSAAERGAVALLEAGHVALEVAVLPEGEDPADWFVARGEAGVDELLERRSPLLDFLIARARARGDGEGIEGRRRAAEDLVRAVAGMPDAIARELALEGVSEGLGISRQALGARAAEIANAPRRMRAAPSTPSAPQRGPAALVQDEGPETLERRTLRAILGAYLNQPPLLRSDPLEDLDLIPRPTARSLIELWTAAVGLGIEAPGALLDRVSDPVAREAARRLLLPEDHDRDLRAQLLGAVVRLRELQQRERVAQHKDRGEVDDLAEIQRLMRERKGRRGS